MTVITAGPITIDTLDRDSTSIRGRSVALTRLEHGLLVALVERRGRTASRVWLHRTVWKHEPADGTRTVDIHISRLRKKLGGSAPLIQTVKGVGYRFDGSPNKNGGRLRRRADFG